jgi:cytochrome c-type biogenesis protein
MVMRFAQGNLGAFVLGSALGLVWTPCAGPVLASILTLIATRDSLVSGAVLLLAYAVGAAVPLLAIGWGGQAVATRVKVFARHSRRLQQGFGAVMIAFA